MAVAVRAAIDVPRPLRPAEILAIGNQKGGVGKTTTAEALAEAFAASGDRVLLVDLDPQASLTASLGVDRAEATTYLYDRLEEWSATGSTPAGEPSPVPSLPGVALLAGDPRLAALERDLLGVARPDLALRAVLEPLRPHFTWILVDCPPSLGTLTTNALTAADRVVIPVLPEPKALDVLELFLVTVAAVRDNGNNPGLEIAGLIVTKMDPRLALARGAVMHLRRSFGDVAPVLGEVRASVRVQEAGSDRIPLLHYRPAREAAHAYAEIGEVLRATRQHRG
jgi:chromosome partitioning protein